MKQFMHSVNLRRHSFSTGFIFDYEANDSKMFVKPRHQTLKDEILESGFLSLGQWKKKVVLKGQKYMKLKKVKERKAGGFRYDGPLEFGTSLSLQHLLSIILYC